MNIKATEIWKIANNDLKNSFNDAASTPTTRHCFCEIWGSHSVKIMMCFSVVTPSGLVYSYQRFGKYILSIFKAGSTYESTQRHNPERRHTDFV
jgi:hypothetical protein